MAKDKIRTLIIEDEYPARQRLQQMLAKHDYIEVLAAVDTGQQAISQIDKLQPDVIFLDIHLPDVNGFEVLNSIGHNPIVIFSTAYEQYAIRAFDEYCVDYLLKPYTSDRLDKSIQKISYHLAQTNRPSMSSELLVQLQEALYPTKQLKTLAVGSSQNITLIDLKDIFYIKSEDKYTFVYKQDGSRWVCNKSMGELINVLSSSFLRVHRSYIVNVDHIEKIRKWIKGRYLITMLDEDSTVLRTSDAYKQAFKEKLQL